MKPTASGKTAMTGIKFLVWTFIGVGVTGIINALPGVHISAQWDVVIVAIVGAIGKMIATYAASRAAENAL